MARILLGVTGGIAAYKACELVAAARPGRARRAAGRDPRGRAVRRRRDVLRARARRAPDRPVPAPAAGRPARRRAADGEHAGAARARARRRPPHRGGARPPRPGARRAGDEHRACGSTRRPRTNLAILVDRGVHVVGPEPGELAEGEVGMGRMAEPEEIAARVAELLAGRPTASPDPAASPGQRGRSRPAGARHRRRHARAARRGALRRQPLVGADGRRARRGGARGAGPR